jgi:CMP-N,N'-diacetyllegionaminic acid synthase
MPGRRGVVAVVPARAGSKRLPGKNVRVFGGRPLIEWSVRAAMASPVVDRIVVSTDDPRVTAAVTGLPVDVMPRPARLATDTASTDDVLRQVDAELGGSTAGPELMVLLQPTSPLREKGQIEAGVQAMRAAPRADRLVEVTSQALFTGRVEDGWWQADFPEDTRTQDLPAVWYPTGRLFIYRAATAFGSVPPGDQRCLAQRAPRERCTNIDDEADLLWAARVYRTFAADYDYLDATTDRTTRHQGS